MNLNLVELSKQNIDQSKAIRSDILQGLGKFPSLNKVANADEIRSSFFGEADYYALELAEIIKQMLIEQYGYVAINMSRAALLGTNKNIVKAMMMIQTENSGSVEYEINAYLSV
ncbi:hypothetical protein LRP52_29215 [Photobacterium sp. ZSDE20]|uniref:Uncharacterized protein n=1 Tax=Photobacterium pectinilyticum TaxID=2906793 RepID=A0ABT1N6A2_9GAMM|nr:hypothetical protein [Photobacterium sp. ZSDE20]MCQ1060273.1 hypothetical protein [Photobacterium sp. ZSDE20]MDD1826260.1 hypothetical protein [Photobacterium sp. ZSDE20]